MSLKKIVHSVKWFFIYTFSPKAREEKRKRAFEESKRELLDFLETMRGRMKEEAERRRRELEASLPYSAEIPTPMVKEILEMQASWNGRPNDIDHFNLLSVIRGNFPQIPVKVNLALEICPDPSRPSFVHWGNPEDENNKDEIASTDPEADQTPTSDQ